MADPKDGVSLFRKVVKFVANPTTEWNDLAARQDDALELERSELKAMIERKRRNDFVRKREFDMLRKLRRDGLTPEQLAALGGGGVEGDSEARLFEASQMRTELGVKAKIDEIEQQMVGENGPYASRRGALPTSAALAADEAARQRQQAPTEPMALRPDSTTPTRAGTSHHLYAPTPVVPTQLLADDPPPDFPTLDASVPPWVAERAPAPAPIGPGPTHHDPALPRISLFDAHESLLSAEPAPGEPASEWMPSGAGTVGPGRSAAAPQQAAAQALEVNEIRHDPDLDESVIAFANADFEQCEDALTELVRPGGARHDHAETWHVLFDFYRAVGQQAAFEGLANEYVVRFGRSSPQWFSLPAQVAAAVAARSPGPSAAVTSAPGWTCPPELEAEAIAVLESATRRMPLPWVLDWSPLVALSSDAADALRALFERWSAQPIEMRWIGAERLFTVLQDAAPTGERGAAPSFWMARLEALRLANRPDRFDEAAIDYCVTFEVSPPSWTKSRCNVRLLGSQHSTVPPSAATSGQASDLDGLDLDAQRAMLTASGELTGQLVGDIQATLQRLDRHLGQARLVSISCSKLIRVDFPAAGDLLNWVLARHGEGRRVTFVDAHRLVALFFGAMGINEHARVQVPRN